MKFYIHVQETPNPDAVKFISQYTVRDEGKSNYANAEEASHVPLAVALFGVEGVKSLFLFDNYVTITREEGASWEAMEQPIIDVLHKELPDHDPLYRDPTEKPREEKDIPPELLEIEKVLDRTVRPYLAADGGGITVQAREGHRLFVQYQGACGTCPSSIAGTLRAIESVLQEEIDPLMEVIETGTAGEMFGGWY